MSARPAFRPTPSLSVYPVPPAGGLMAILRAYFDDSGDAKNPRDRVLTIAGYVSTHELWGKFDAAWTAALGSFPYLHMKEFGDPNGIYKEVKSDPKKEAAFVGNLIEVISVHTRIGAHATVLLDDLKKFNEKHNRQLNAYALGVYGCIMCLQWAFPTAEMEIFFDKFDDATTLIEEGLSYAESDIYQPLNPNLIVATAIRKAESWRTILPLQAADFIAWEMRKLLFDRLTWVNGQQFFQLSPQTAIQSYNRWIQDYTKEHGKEPRNRRSFLALKQDTRPDGHVFNYENLELLEFRHPHGWKLNKGGGGLAIFSGDQGA